MNTILQIGKDKYIAGRVYDSLDEALAHQEPSWANVASVYGSPAPVMFPLASVPVEYTAWEKALNRVEQGQAAAKKLIPGTIQEIEIDTDALIDKIFPISKGLTIHEVAAILNCKYRQVQHLLVTGRITSHNVAKAGSLVKRHRISRASVKAFLKTPEGKYKYPNVKI